MDANDGRRDEPRARTHVRPWKIVRLVLAGGALVGVGAGMTSSAWTDVAWFSATATTPTIQLQGGNGAAPTTFYNADGVTPVTIPATAFANLAPSVATQVHIGLKNVSTVPLTVPLPTVAWSADFATGQSCALATYTTVTMTPAAPVTLAALTGQTTDVLVTVTPPASWNGSATCQNKSGTLTLTFTGSTF